MSRNYLVSIGILFLAVVVTGNSIFAQERLPVPAQDQQRKALKAIKEVFKDSYRDRSAAGTEARVKLFLETALDSQESVIDQYVLLNMSMQESAATGNVSLAIKSCQAISKRFEVDIVESRIEVLNELSRNLPDIQSANSYLSAADQMANEFIAGDQYESAKRLLDRMQAIAKKGQMQYWREKLRSQTRHVTKLGKAFKALSGDLTQLEGEPEDAAANRNVGRFYFLQKADFAKGIAFLKHSDPESPLTTIALAELAASDVVERIVVADQWWELAVEPPASLGFDKTTSMVVQKHAASLYQATMDETAGLEKKRIEGRLAEFNRLFGGAWLETLTTQPWRIVWSAQGDWKEVRFSRKGTVAITILSNGKLVEYQWESISESEIRIAVPEHSKIYVLSMAKDGTLQGQRYNSKTNKEAGTGKSIPFRN